MARRKFNIGDKAIFIHENQLFERPVHHIEIGIMREEQDGYYVQYYFDIDRGTTLNLIYKYETEVAGNVEELLRSLKINDNY